MIGAPSVPWVYDHQVTTIGSGRLQFVPMKSVGVRDFRDHATKYLSGVEPLAVERHGRVIGLYFPVRADKDEARRALDRIDATVEELLARTGMTPEELAKAFETEPPS